MIANRRGRNSCVGGCAFDGGGVGRRKGDEAHVEGGLVPGNRLTCSQYSSGIHAASNPIPMEFRGGKYFGVAPV